MFWSYGFIITWRSMLQVLVQVTSKSVPDSLLHQNHMTTADFISVLIELFDEASASGVSTSSLLLKTLTILFNLGEKSRSILPESFSFYIWIVCCSIKWDPLRRFVLPIPDRGSRLQSFAQTSIRSLQQQQQQCVHGRQWRCSSLVCWAPNSTGGAATPLPRHLLAKAEHGDEPRRTAGISGR